MWRGVRALRRLHRQSRLGRAGLDLEEGRGREASRRKGREVFIFMTCLSSIRCIIIFRANLCNFCYDHSSFSFYGPRVRQAVRRYMYSRKALSSVQCRDKDDLVPVFQLIIPFALQLPVRIVHEYQDPRPSIIYCNININHQLFV